MPKRNGIKHKDPPPEQNGLTLFLAPLVAAILFVIALVQSLLERRVYPPVAVAEGAAAPRPAGPVLPRKRRGLDAIKARLERAPFIGRVLEVQNRYSELRGNNLASAVTFQAFVSLFPLILVIVAVVGFVAHNSDTDVAGRIVNALGLRGESATTVSNAVATAKENRTATAPIALVGLLWSGLGLVNAFQFAFNQVWQVDERGIKDKAVGLAWLIGAVLLFVATAAVTTVLNWLPGVVAPLGIVVGLAVNFGLWMWTFRVLPNRSLPWGALVPGAIVGAVGMEILKVVGGIYVPRAVAHSSELYGSLGVMFAVLAWLLFFGRLSVYAAVVNVVRWERVRGTKSATIEVPAGPDVTPTASVSRVGRLQREDVNT